MRLEPHTIGSPVRSISEFSTMMIPPVEYMPFQPLLAARRFLLVPRCTQADHCTAEIFVGCVKCPDLAAGKQGLLWNAVDSHGFCSDKYIHI